MDEILQAIKSSGKEHFFRGERFLIDLKSGEFIVEVVYVQCKGYIDNKVKKIPWSVNFEDKDKTNIKITLNESLQLHLIKNLTPPAVKKVCVTIEIKSPTPLVVDPSFDYKKIVNSFLLTLQKNIIILNSTFVIEDKPKYSVIGRVSGLDFVGERPTAEEDIRQCGLNTDETSVCYYRNDKEIKEEAPKKEAVEKDPIIALENLGIGGFSKDTEKQIRDLFAGLGKNSHIYEMLNIKPEKGILLYGPPGTGKTVLAKGLAKVFGAPEDQIKYLAAPSVFGGHYGESEANIRRPFESIIKAYNEGNQGPFVWIIDEIEAMLPKRSGLSANSHTYTSVVAQFLSLMDGGLPLPPKTIIIGITNNRDYLDPAVIRPGRFGKQIKVALPDERGIVKIFEIHTRKFKEKGMLGNDVDFKDLAAWMKGWSGAYIESCVNDAARIATQKFEKRYEEVKLNADYLIGLKIWNRDFLEAAHNMRDTLQDSRDLKH